MGPTGPKETVVIVDGVDESDVKASGVEEFSHFQHGIDVPLSRIRYANYMGLFSVVNHRRCHFLFLLRKDECGLFFVLGKCNFSLALVSTYAIYREERKARLYVFLPRVDRRKIYLTCERYPQLS